MSLLCTHGELRNSYKVHTKYRSCLLDKRVFKSSAPTDSLLTDRISYSTTKPHKLLHVTLKKNKKIIPTLSIDIMTKKKFSFRIHELVAMRVTQSVAFAKQYNRSFVRVLPPPGKRAGSQQAFQISLGDNNSLQCQAFHDVLVTYAKLLKNRSRCPCI